MKLWEVITGRLSEMAFERGELESKITSESYQVVQHLIKLLKWDDPVNANKHARDANNWLFKIQSFKMKKNRRPKSQDYYQWMFIDNVGDEITIARFIRGMHEYQSLPVSRTDREVYDIIQDLIRRISPDLAANNFDGIENYLSLDK